MIAITQARNVEPSRDFLDEQQARSRDKVANPRLLRRRLSDVGFTALPADHLAAVRDQEPSPLTHAARRKSIGELEPRARRTTLSSTSAATLAMRSNCFAGS